MSVEYTEFTMIDAKVVGTNTIVFMLEDGTKILVKVEMNQCGKRIGANGAPEYHFSFGNHVKIIPKNKKFRVPIQPQPKLQPQDKSGVV